MKCPVCIDPDLMMSERQGVEIDYCPKCRGVWLDRGELDKLIERSQSVPPETYREESYSRGSHEPNDYRRRKRRGLLGDIFDFD
jgi:Zn-finger nucleic acid-binding protein